MAFNIARILESAPKLPYENNEKGMALFVTAKTNECFQAGWSNIRYFFLNKIGIKTKEAIMKEYYEAPKGRVQDTPVKKVAMPQPIPQKEVVETKVINPTKKPQPVEGIKQTKKVDTFKPKPVSQPKKEEPKSGIDAALEGID